MQRICFSQNFLFTFTEFLSLKSSILQLKSQGKTADDEVKGKNPVKTEPYTFPDGESTSMKMIYIVV